MPVREAHALGGEAVEVWRGDLTPRWIIGAYISVAEVVGEDDEDVRRPVGGEQSDREQQVE
jgi:hypothetical protein